MSSAHKGHGGHDDHDKSRRDKSGGNKRPASKSASPPAQIPPKSGRENTPQNLGSGSRGGTGGASNTQRNPMAISALVNPTASGGGAGGASNTQRNPMDINALLNPTPNPTSSGRMNISTMIHTGSEQNVGRSQPQKSSSPSQSRQGTTNNPSQPRTSSGSSIPGFSSLALDNPQQSSQGSTRQSHSLTHSSQHSTGSGGSMSDSHHNLPLMTGPVLDRPMMYSEPSSIPQSYGGGPGQMGYSQGQQPYRTQPSGSSSGPANPLSQPSAFVPILTLPNHPNHPYPHGSPAANKAWMEQMMRLCATDGNGGMRRYLQLQPKTWSRAQIVKHEVPYTPGVCMHAGCHKQTGNAGQSKSEIARDLLHHVVLDHPNMLLVCPVCSHVHLKASFESFMRLGQHMARTNGGLCDGVVAAKKAKKEGMIEEEKIARARGMDMNPIPASDWFDQSMQSGYSGLRKYIFAPKTWHRYAGLEPLRTAPPFTRGVCMHPGCHAQATGSTGKDITNDLLRHVVQDHWDRDSLKRCPVCRQVFAGWNHMEAHMKAFRDVCTGDGGNH